MHISEVGQKLIKTFEGAALSKSIVKDLEEQVSNLITAPINQNQFDALFSFASNMGVTILENSSLLKRINSLEDPCEVAKEELHKWNKESGQIFQALSRRRSAELELFCQKPPDFKWGWVSITSRTKTFLKKRPVDVKLLESEEKADVVRNRSIRRCQVIERSDGHTYLELGFGLGKWWVFDGHWSGLRSEVSIHPYAVKDNLSYLREFPYIGHDPDDIDNSLKSQSFCMAMVMKYLDAKGINTFNDYLKVLNKHGINSSKESQLKTIRELGYTATFGMSYDEDDIKDNLKRGLPVVVSLISQGPISEPKRGPHSVVITGYDYDSWLVQDPFGELNLVDGGFTERNPVVGKNIKYPYEQFNRRLFAAGGATGWGWLNFREYFDKN